MSNTFTPPPTTTGAPTTTTGIASPFKYPVIWDSISLGGGAFTWNGRVQFKGAKRSYNWQVKTPPGVQGEVYTYRGLHTHPFRMLIEVWTDDQWQMLPDLLSFFTYDATKPNPNGPANPVDIYHPTLSLVDISQVLCLDIVAPEVDQEHSGAAWIEFVLREYRPAVISTNVTATPAATQVPIVVLNQSGGSLGQKIQTQTQAVEALANDLPTTGTLP